MLNTSISVFAANVRIHDSLRSNRVVTGRLIVPDPGALTHAFPPGAARPRHRAGADSAGGRLRRRCSPNGQLWPRGRTPIAPIHIGCRGIPPSVEPPARSHDNLYLHDGSTHDNHHLHNGASTGNAAGSGAHRHDDNSTSATTSTGTGTLSPGGGTRSR